MVIIQYTLTLIVIIYVALLTYNSLSELNDIDNLFN